MSETPKRRGFIGAAIASLAVAPSALADPPAPGAAASASPTDVDSTKAAVDAAVARCRREGDARRMEEQAAYGKALVARFGPGVVEAIRDTTIARAKHWLQSAKIAERDLGAVHGFWKDLPPEFEWSLVEETPIRLQFEVRKCPIADAMRRHGAPELGFAYNCAFDIGYCQGLNPAIRFTRTKTLMMGDTTCNHTYELAKGPGASSQGPDEHETKRAAR